MHKIKIHSLIGVVLLSFVLSACGDRAAMTVTNKPPADDDDNTKDGKKPKDSRACYNSLCFKTTAAKDLVDPKGDYVYPDPSTFSRADQRKHYGRPSFFIDLQGVDTNAQIAPNFRLRDFMLEAKGRYGIFSALVLERVQAIRNAIAKPVIINSGYRSPGYNSRIDGSAKWSRHTYGDAVDFKVGGVKPDALSNYCEKQNASFYLVYKTHIHCDWRTATKDPAFYPASPKSARPEVELSPQQVFAQTVTALQQASQFQFFEQNGERTISLAIPIEEEEGELLYAWTVTTPDGMVLTSQEASIAIPPTHGTYRVQVVAGGSLHFDELIDW